MEINDPGVTTSPVVEPAAPAASAPSAPTGSEPVINTGKPEEQTVPFTRFQEVNDKAKEAEDRATRLESELAEAKKPPQTPQIEEEDVDPEVVTLVEKSAKKLGYVSQKDLDLRDAQIQVKQDIGDLTSQYKDSGIAFDGQKVIDYAKANGMPIGSKKSLDAVYKEMNYDSIIEAQRKAAIAGYQESAKSGAEKPGPQGAKPPVEAKPGNLKERIAAARQKSGFSIT